MKPLRLRLQAFGPYPRRSEVDFRPLASGGLFLIHGPTGAGKTSILDGLSFALFGSASGGERASDALRSDRAPADVLTEARLEFALGADVYRVTREPKQQVAKLRGEGLKTSAPKGVLEKLATREADLDEGTWDLVASGDTKVTEAIVELLGMTEEQFRQVVVLPQGQFRKFLSAGSTEREDLLEQLFRTHRFRELTEMMQERSEALAKSVADERAKAAALLTSLDVSTAEDLDLKADESRARLAELERTAPDLETLHARESDRLSSARSFAKARAELVSLEAKKLDLDRERAEIEGFRRALADERRSRPVTDCDRRVREIESDIAQLGRDADQAEAARVKAMNEVTRSRETLSQLEAKRTEAGTWDVERRKIEDLLPKVSRLLALANEGRTLGETAARYDRETEDLERRLDETKSKRPALQKKIDDLQDLFAKAAEIAEDLGRLTAEKDDAAKLFVRIGDLEKRRETAHRTRTELDDIEKEWSAKQRDLSRAKLAYHQAQAARLAAELEDGDPCPVCGSTTHPDLAHAAPGAPSQEALDSMEADFARLTDSRARAKSRLESLEAEIASASEELATSLEGPAEEWKSRIVAKGSALKSRIEVLQAQKLASQEAKAAFEAARRERETLETSVAGFETKLTASRAKRDEAREKARSLAAQLAELERDVPADRRDLAALEERGKSLAAALDRFRAEEASARESGDKAAAAGAAATERAKTLSERIVTRTKDLESATTAREEAIRKAGFSTLEEARRAALPDSELARLEERVRRHETEGARLDGQLQKLRADVAAAPEDVRDLAAIESSFAEIDRRRMNAQAERMALAERLVQLEKARERSRDTAAEIARLEQRYSFVGRLADVSLGRPPNELRINFQRYVLASRLDEVLEQASRRLHTMSRGQFTLRRARKAEDKRRSAGLDLEVEDAYTGTARATASLSGGEGFLASLALALGVADVVQMHLGGVRLEAVFVDEGFGTLDPEALELAMRVLADLQAGGRIVGVISHVPELRDQIARRLAVRKTVDGSEIAWETGSI